MRSRPLLVLALLLVSSLLSCPRAPEAVDAAPASGGPDGGTTSGSCTSFCLGNGDHCVFGSNQDNSIDGGLLFVNKRNVEKTGWEAGTTGRYARWISRYGSVTVVHGGYQMAWAGMNEAGLTISTMALHESEDPTPDERPPLGSSFWVQYQLDSHSTIDEVIASDSRVRIADTVDHYLVCDASGACAVIEFLDGQMVAHSGETLPVAALSNDKYADSVRAWRSGRPRNNRQERFVGAADAVEAFQPASAEVALATAFETLARVALENNAWQLVFDPAELRLHFLSSHNPQLRTVDFARLNFSCRSPVLMLDVHAELAGDISGRLEPYSHRISLNHTLAFLEAYERLDYPPFLVESLLGGIERFRCMETEGDAAPVPGDLAGDGPLLPVKLTWGVMTIMRRVGPAWIGLTVLSLAIVAWRQASAPLRLRGRAWLWLLLVALLGPLGFAVYALVQRRRRNP